MHLSNRTTLALLGLALVACGPDVHETPEWMLDVFSDPGPGNRTIGLDSVSHYEFRDDGVLVVVALSECQANVEGVASEFAWTRTGDDQVVVSLPEEDAFDEWRITRSDDCRTVRLDRMQHGDPAVSFDLTRGPVCMRALPPCPEGTSCETCETVWCEDGPSACE